MGPTYKNFRPPGQNFDNPASTLGNPAISGRRKSDAAKIVPLTAKSRLKISRITRIANNICYQVLLRCCVGKCPCGVQEHAKLPESGTGGGGCTAPLTLSKGKCETSKPPSLKPFDAILRPEAPSAPDLLARKRHPVLVDNLYWTSSSTALNGWIVAAPVLHALHEAWRVLFRINRSRTGPTSVAKRRNCITMRLLDS